ncbi:DUF2946 family protein [Nisaea sediminum]|uniref:DUF2946 family protein n=1 Tax=Nisaea sediminum TaxID=2775867 RepID=UPI0018676011|nr:DUF2946 family protein [Nisaea sediminum]
MARADLTTAELRSAPAPAHRRRRFLAAWIGLFAFVLQFGFSFGTAASLGKPLPGSLAADLAALCLDATDGTGGGTETASHPCDHCRLCGGSFTYLPEAEQSPEPLRVLRSFSAELPRSAPARRTVSSEFPRAPPL